MTDQLKTVLVTGGAGNVGSALVKRLLARGNYFVVVVDDLSTGHMHNLPDRETENYRFIKCDVNNYKSIASVMFSHQFDFIFHFAAVVGVARTLKHPVNVLSDIDGIKNILELSRNSGVQRVFYSSSSEVYGEPVEIPQNEHTTPLNSRLPYAVVKNVGEAFLRSYKQEYDLDYTIFRFFNTYGPEQSLDFVIPRFLKQAIKGEPISIYGDGKQSRTFCYIDDNTEALVRILEQNQHINDVVNIGSDLELSVLELAQRIITVTDSKSEIIHLPALPEGDMSRRRPDTAKMKKVLDHQLVSLEDGLQRIIDHPNFQRSLDN